MSYLSSVSSCIRTLIVSHLMAYWKPFFVIITHSRQRWNLWWSIFGKATSSRLLPPSLPWHFLASLVGDTLLWRVGPDLIIFLNLPSESLYYIQQFCCGHIGALTFFGGILFSITFPLSVPGRSLSLQFIQSVQKIAWSSYGLLRRYIFSTLQANQSPKDRCIAGAHSCE